MSILALLTHQNHHNILNVWKKEPVLTLQVPFSFTSTISTPWKHPSQPLNKTSASLVSLPRSFKCHVYSFLCFPRLHSYSKSISHTFITFEHTRPLPSWHNANTITKDWSLSWRRFGHIWRTVLDGYLFHLPRSEYDNEKVSLWKTCTYYYSQN